MKMTYMNAFEKIKEKLSKVTSEKFTRDFAIQVNLVNKDCAGIFYVANLGGVFSVEPYDYKDNSAMITLMMGDFTKLVEGGLKLDKAIESGKLEIVGDADAVAQLSGIVEAPKKAPVKKAPVKKAAPVKKEAVKKEVPAKKEITEKKTEKKPEKKTEKKTK